MSNPAEGLLTPGGMLTGNERFLRSNRGAADFVGNDSQSRQGFVGMTQAREPGPLPAAATAREKNRPNINQMLSSESPRARASARRGSSSRPRLSGPTTTAVATSLESHLVGRRWHGSARHRDDGRPDGDPAG